MTHAVWLYASAFEREVLTAGQTNAGWRDRCRQGGSLREMVSDSFLVAQRTTNQMPPAEFRIVPIAGARG